MNAAPAQLHEKEIRDAEELLFAGPQKLGFAKGLFQGRFVADWVLPYPSLLADQHNIRRNVHAYIRGFSPNARDAGIRTTGASPCGLASPRSGWCARTR